LTAAPHRRSDESRQGGPAAVGLRFGLRAVQVISPVKMGTKIMAPWPNLACSKLAAAERRFLQIAEEYRWLNPHLDLTPVLKIRPLF
jgi:hypothetical protein